jgi:epoxide hydrolase 4
MEHNFTSTFIQTNGVRLHAVQAGDPASPLVILLHGFPEFWYSWKNQINPLAQAGFHVLVPDLRGYNLSDKPARVSAYHLDELAQDILALVEWAGKEKALLAGHDWGGLLAWHLAIRFPERFEKVAVVNAPHPLDAKHNLKRNPVQMMRSLYALFFQIPWLPETMLRANDWKMLEASMQKTSRPGTFTPSDFEEYRQAWWRKGAITTMLNWYRANFRRAPVYPAGAEVTIPVQMIWGAKDFALGQEMVKPSLERCRKGQILLLEEATHWVQHEEAGQVSETLIGFFKQ